MARVVAVVLAVVLAVVAVAAAVAVVVVVVEVEAQGGRVGRQQLRWWCAKRMLQVMLVGVAVPGMVASSVRVRIGGALLWGAGRCRLCAGSSRTAVLIQL